MQFVNFCSLFGKFGSFYLSLNSRGCILWGIFGLFAKGLFNLDPRITPIWVIQMRQLCSGLILLLIAQLTGQEPCQVWKDRGSAVKLLAYAVIALNWTLRVKVKARVNK